MDKLALASAALQLLEQRYPLDFPYAPTVSAERQTTEINKLKSTLDFEQCFFVFNLPERRLENVHGFTNWFGYPDNSFNLMTYFNAIHPGFMETLHINAQAAFNTANEPKQAVRFMDDKVVTNLPIRHRNGHYILTKRSLYPFQIDKSGLVTAYLNHFILLKPYEQTDRTDFRTGKRQTLVNQDVAAAVKEQRLLTLEQDNISKTFSQNEWKVLHELVADPEVTQTQIAEKLNIRKETIQKTYNHRILKKARQRFEPHEFTSIKDVAAFLKLYDFV
jgi:hypothetical protein